MDRFNQVQKEIIDEHRSNMESELKISGKKSHNSYRVKTKTKIEARTGKAFAIGISMRQHGVFKEKGVGRGRGINSGKTKPDPWYNPVILREVPKLAQDLELNIADITYKALIK